MIKTSLFICKQSAVAAAGYMKCITCFALEKNFLQETWVRLKTLNIKAFMNCSMLEHYCAAESAIKGRKLVSESITAY